MEDLNHLLGRWLLRFLRCSPFLQPREALYLQQLFFVIGPFRES